MATDFGARVARSRKHAGLTQKQLAPMVGMSQSNLSELEAVAFESGKTAQIARQCGVNAYWLATGEGSMLDLAPVAAVPVVSIDRALEVLPRHITIKSAYRLTHKTGCPILAPS